MKQRNANLLAHERYKETLAIWHNLMRFWVANRTDQDIPPEWAIASNFYHGVRKEYNEEIKQIIDGGGDAYTKIHKIREMIND